MKIGFIGLGNMAKAMIGGMLEKKIAQPEEILGSARTQATLDAVSEEYGILVSASNREVADWAEILVLAVKPQMLAEVICEITDSIRQETLLLSVAAGKTIAWIEEAFGGNYKVVRCMPNTPAMVGAGCSGVCRNERVSEEEMELCMALAGSFGMAREIPEKLIDAVGAVSGSSRFCVHVYRGSCRQCRQGGDDQKGRLSFRGPGGFRKRKADAGEREASRGIKGYGMLAGRDYNRRGSGA